MSSSNGKVWLFFSFLSFLFLIGCSKKNPVKKGTHIPRIAKAYVTRNDRSVAVFDLEKARKIKDIPVGRVSKSVAITPDDSKILVAQPSANAVWVIDAKSYAVIDQIGLDTPAYIAISCDGSYAYVTSNSSNYISQTSLNTFTQTHSFQAGDYPLGVVENPLNGDLLVSNRIPNLYSGNIIVLDSNFVAQDTINVAGFPTAMVFSKDRTLLWVTVGISGEDGSLLSIDAGDYTNKSSLTGEVSS